MIADALRSSKKPILLVVNKTDNNRLQQEAVEFYGLGIGNIHTISATHGMGVADLLDETCLLFPPGEEEPIIEDGRIRISIIGRPNVGKSSLLNSILGEERSIVSPIPGTTRDAIDTSFEWDGTPLTLVDTAGIRKSGKIQGTIEYYMVMRAQGALERSNVGCVVIDGSAGILEGDKRVAGLAHDGGRGCIIVVNKWDLVDAGVIYRPGQSRRPDKLKIQKFTDMFRKECPFLAYAPLVFISAQERFGVKHTLEAAIHAAHNHSHRIPTGELNRLVRDAIERRPLMSHGRSFKVYYSTMASVEPPRIVMFCNDSEMLHFSYKRYLENQLRETYPLEGTPIRIEARKIMNKEEKEKESKK